MRRLRVKWEYDHKTSIGVATCGNAIVQVTGDLAENFAIGFGPNCPAHALAITADEAEELAAALAKATKKAFSIFDDRAQQANDMRPDDDD